MIVRATSPEGVRWIIDIPDQPYRPEWSSDELMVELRGDKYPFYDQLRWIGGKPFLRIPPEAGRRGPEVYPHWDEWHELAGKVILPERLQ